MMGQGDKKIRIRRTNEQLDKEVISEFEKLVGEKLMCFIEDMVRWIIFMTDWPSNTTSGSIIPLIFPHLIH